MLTDEVFLFCLLAVVFLFTAGCVTHLYTFNSIQLFQNPLLHLRNIKAPFPALAMYTFYYKDGLAGNSACSFSAQHAKGYCSQLK
jgi:hypothetical protein